MTFACHFGRCRYIRSSFRTAPAGDVFQRKINEILKELPNVFGMSDDLLVVGHDQHVTDHDATLHRVL